MLKYSDLEEREQRRLIKDIIDDDVIPTSERTQLIQNLLSDIYCCKCYCTHSDCICGKLSKTEN